MGIKILSVVLIAVFLVALLVGTIIILFVFPGLFVFIPTDFKDDNIYYSYHGRVPVYQENYIGTRQNECVPDKHIRDNGIPVVGLSTQFQYKGYYFPDEKIITIGSDEYKFVTPYTSVRRALDSSEGACSSPVYKTEVFKNGQKIDELNFPQGSETICTTYNTKNIERTYDDLKVNFAKVYEYGGQRSSCDRTRQAYVIHRYEVIIDEPSNESNPPLTEEEFDELVEENIREIWVIKDNKCIQVADFSKDQINNFNYISKGACEGVLDDVPQENQTGQVQQEEEGISLLIWIIIIGSGIILLLVIIAIVFALTNRRK